MSQLMLKKKCAAFIIMHHLIKKKETDSKKRRYWMKHLYKHRVEGEGLLNILSLDDSTGHFKNFLRMSVQDFEMFVNLIGPKIQKQNTNYRESIPVKDRLGLTLRFLFTGDSYTSLQYLFKISKQAISLIVPEVCKALIEVLRDNIKMPSTPEGWLKVAQDYEEIWNFPHCIGSIDGKHIMLQPPFNSASESNNHKGFFSILLFALVDANYNFIYVDIGCQDRISDGGEFKHTELYKKIKCNTLGLPPPKPLPGIQKDIPYVIVGNEAFILTTNVMKPFAGDHRIGSRERIFNYRLSRARRVVENVFGITSSVFGVLRKPILLEPKKADAIVMTIVCLHNYLMNSKSSNKIYSPPGTFDTEVEGHLVNGSWRSSETSENLRNLRNIPRRSLSQAHKVREEFCTYFTTQGVAEWQLDC